VPYRALECAHAAAQDHRPYHQTSRREFDPRSDPHLRVLLSVKGAFSERDFESAILGEFEGVLLELGHGFTFIARQKRMTAGKDNFHLTSTCSFSTATCAA